MRSSVIDAKRSENEGEKYPSSEPVFQPKSFDSNRSYRSHNANRPPGLRRSPSKVALKSAKWLSFFVPAEGWLPLLLLAVALYSVVFSIIAANWVNHSTLLLWSPALGLLIGLLIAKIPNFPQAVLHLLVCLLGYWLAILLTSLVAFHMPWMQLLVGLQGALTGNISSKIVPTSEVVFFFYLTFLCYFLGYFGSWLAYRAHLPWLVALVYCSIMLVNLNYVKRDLTLLVVVMLGALLLLIAHMQLIAQIVQWRREGLHTDRLWLKSMTMRGMQVASIIAVLSLLISSFLPFPAQPSQGRAFWDSVDNMWMNIVNGHASLQNLGTLMAPYQPSANFFGDQLTITGSVHLPTGEVLNYVPSDNGHYLEGFTFNNFDGHTWKSTLTPADSTLFDRNVPLYLDTSRDDYSQVKTAITVVQPPDGTQNYLFAPAQPVSFTVPTMIYGDGTASSWLQQSPLMRNEQYTVISMVLPQLNDQNLMAVPLPHGNNGQNIWSQDGYYMKIVSADTQLPSDLSPNVIARTQQWTRGAPNAYTALKMLEARLGDQNTFSYSVDNPPIPSNMDVVDWLFKTRSGYCTYYASAMAVMGRQLGIPMRVVNGFSLGHFDLQRKVWIVEGSDAHSWVQAYFPTFGWVDFDPTPGYSLHPQAPAQPTPTAKSGQQARQPGVTPTPPVKSTPLATPANNKQQSNPRKNPVSGKENGVVIDQNVLMGLSVGVLLLSMLLFISALVTYWWRSMYANSSFIAGMYWRFCYLARWVGLAPRTWQTPYEYSNMLRRQFPQDTAPLGRLTELFVRDRWGAPQHTPLAPEEEDVQHLWPILRKFVLRQFFHKVKRP